MKTVQRLQRVPFFVLRRLTPCHYIVPLLLALMVMQARRELRVRSRTVSPTATSPWTAA